MQPYSFRLAERQVSPLSTVNAIYTVPAGKRVILRDLSGYSGAVGGGFLLMGVNGNLRFSVQATAQFGPFHWDGRVVLNAGDTLDEYSTASAYYVASGYIFEV